MEAGAEINQQYLVVEHVGRGGMADVWSARDKRLNRTVAIKTVARDLSAEHGAEPLVLFEREAQTIAQLEHPHILPIYDFGEFQSQLYIVMRFVTGGSLEDILQAGALPVAETLRIGRAVAGALDHAHASHVVHLDIKPSNILLDSNHSPYLADFGLAAVIGPEGRAANPGYGTLLYMAPEQLTESVLDHRADIYAFTILIFHMLTGELPFDATTSLALKQLQFQEDLPNLDNLPAGLTPILRRGTALDPQTRPATLMELIHELEGVLMGQAQAQGTPDMLPYLSDLGDEVDSAVMEVGVTLNVSEALSAEEMAKREAEGLYQRARRAWAFGQGRFLLGITHFMLMNDYYTRADQHELELDEAGMQMLLRGAIEYDYEINYWWGKLNNDSRRWVTLHAVRSESAPARTRAFYRLETLPDSDPAKIPTLVAQALQVEQDHAAKRAAIHVLATRAQIMAREEYEVTGEMSGSLLTTRSRIGIQLRTPKVWKERIYTPDIDLLLAEIAMDPTEPLIAEQAARTIGRIRSLTAVRDIAEQHRLGKKGALRALALVRDEAPSLPNVVSTRARFYAWLDNTLRRVFGQPMGLVWRYLWGFIGGFLALGGYAWYIQPDIGVLLAQRSGLAMSTGLIYGLCVGFIALLAGEVPARLRGFWRWWSRTLASLLFGAVMGSVTWAAFTWFNLNYLPEWPVMLLGGMGLALGYVLTTALRLPGWLAVIVTAISVYLPLHITSTMALNVTPATTMVTPLVYFLNLLTFELDYSKLYTLGAWIAILTAVGGHAQALWQDIFSVWRRIWAQVQKPSNQPQKTI